MVRDWIDYLAQPKGDSVQPAARSVDRVGREGRSCSEVMRQKARRPGLLSTPQGDVIELTGERRSDALLFHSSRTRLPGEYVLEVGLADWKIPFHVRRDPGESDLSGLDSSTFERLVGWTTPSIDPDQIAETVSSQADPVWPYLLIGLIMLITGELALSGILARERFGSAGIPEFSELDAPVSNGMVGMNSPRDPIDPCWKRFVPALRKVIDDGTDRNHSE